MLGSVKTLPILAGETLRNIRQSVTTPNSHFGPPYLRVVAFRAKRERLTDHPSSYRLTLLLPPYFRISFYFHGAASTIPEPGELPIGCDPDVRLTPAALALVRGRFLPAGRDGAGSHTSYGQEGPVLEADEAADIEEVQA